MKYILTDCFNPIELFSILELQKASVIIATFINYLKFAEVNGDKVLNIDSCKGFFLTLKSHLNG